MPVTQVPIFNDEEFNLFQRRFENDYNLFNDKDHVLWVNENYPGFLPSTSGIVGD